MFLINSRQGDVRCGLLKTGRASPEVTPAFLPSSLRRDHPFALGYSPRAPVSVFRYGHLFAYPLEVFLGGLFGEVVCKNRLLSLVDCVI